MPSREEVQDAIAQARGTAAPQYGDSVQDAIRQAHEYEPSEPAVAPVAEKPSAGSRFVHGLTDLPTGLGQIAEHVAETPLNALRWAIRKGLNSVGAKEAATLFDPVSTEEFDGIVSNREKDYQKARSAAQQTGIDWWRLGGAAANPLNYAMPGGAAASVAGRIGQAAAQGAMVAAAQPSESAPGSFWWDKAKSALAGAATGAIVSGAIEATMPLVKMGVNAARKALGGSKAAAATPAAEVVVNDALKAKGVDPATLDINVLSGMKQEVQSALDHGAEPSAEAIANRAIGESLPIPVRFMRGQATGDAAAFSAEQNLRGIQGVGEPLTTRLTEQNNAFVQNLDALGAKDAPDPVSTSNWVADKLHSTWDALQSRKDQLYDAVRNSKGQPAMMDQFTAAQSIRDTLDTPEASHAFDLLPANIQRTIDDLADGKLPLTVAQMQQLDKAWGAAASGASDGSVRHAINTARSILNEAPISDEVGQEAKQAYQLARQAHAQQMSLIDPKLPNGRPNPNFQPMMKAVIADGKPPEKLFADQFLNAAPSVAKKNLALLQSIDPASAETVGKTLMGEIKRAALSSASDERGTVSQAVLNNWARDPMKAARMDALLPQPLVGTFRNLAKAVEIAKRFPVASTVNTSNTGSAVVNAGTSMLKNSAWAQIAKRVPVISTIAEGKAAADTATAVNSTLNPGVTLKSLASATPRQAFGNRLAAQAAIPAFIARKKSDEKSAEK